MKAIIFQHSHTSPAGSSTEWCKSRGFGSEILWPSELTRWPTLESFDLLILCGGGMNVDEEHLHPWLRQEKDFIAKAIAAKKKIVGLCLGAQLIAEVLGAEVKALGTWEFGWHEVKLCEPNFMGESGLSGESDESETLKVFEYHGYCFTLPDGTKQTATNTHWPHQAFENENIKAYQFHPEVTGAMVEVFLDDPKIPVSGFTQTRTQIESQTQTLQPLLQSWYFNQLDSLMVDDA